MFPGILMSKDIPLYLKPVKLTILIQTAVLFTEERQVSINMNQNVETIIRIMFIEPCLTTSSSVDER